MATPIGTLGTIPTLTVAGRVFTDLTNLIYLGTVISGGPTDATFRLLSGSGGAGYQVTGGKTLTIYAISAVTKTNNSIGLGLVQSDNDCGFSGSFSNPVYEIGDVASDMHALNSVIGTGIIQSNCEDQAFFQVAATKYLGLRNDAAANIKCKAFGYET